jgi:hypothetical protein
MARKMAQSRTAAKKRDRSGGKSVSTPELNEMQTLEAALTPKEWNEIQQLYQQYAVLALAQETNVLSGQEIVKHAGTRFVLRPSGARRTPDPSTNSTPSGGA